jgi:hypothetical protein
MNTAKTLMLAALAAMSLGVGTAMAQDGGGSMTPANDYWTLQQRALYAHRAPVVSPQVQSGSSDTDAMTHSGTGRGAPVHFNYGALANPG